MCILIMYLSSSCLLSFSYPDKRSCGVGFWEEYHVVLVVAVFPGPSQFPSLIEGYGLQIYWRIWSLLNARDWKYASTWVGFQDKSYASVLFQLYSKPCHNLENYFDASFIIKAQLICINMILPHFLCFNSLEFASLSLFQL